MDECMKTIKVVAAVIKSNDEIFAEADKKLYSIKSERTNVNA